MKKIISLFARNYDGDFKVRNEVVKGAEWVIAGEGVATVKHDGTCCMVRNGKLYRRLTLRGLVAMDCGQKPEGFEPSSPYDPVKEKQEGWVPVGDGPDDKWHRMGQEIVNIWKLEDGTYELVGPKIQGNPEQLDSIHLVKHGKNRLPGAPRDFDGIKEFLADRTIEGIVWHHPDGRMVKIKARDFGIRWPR